MENSSDNNKKKWKDLVTPSEHAPVPRPRGAWRLEAAGEREMGMGRGDSGCCPLLLLLLLLLLLCSAPVLASKGKRQAGRQAGTSTCVYLWYFVRGQNTSFAVTLSRRCYCALRVLLGEKNLRGTYTAGTSVLAQYERPLSVRRAPQRSHTPSSPSTPITTPASAWVSNDGIPEPGVAEMTSRVGTGVGSRRGLASHGFSNCTAAICLVFPSDSGGFCCSRSVAGVPSDRVPEKILLGGAGWEGGALVGWAD